MFVGSIRYSHKAQRRAEHLNIRKYKNQTSSGTPQLDSMELPFWKAPNSLLSPSLFFDLLCTLSSIFYLSVDSLSHSILKIWSRSHSTDLQREPVLPFSAMGLKSQGRDSDWFTCVRCLLWTNQLYIEQCTCHHTNMAAVTLRREGRRGSSLGVVVVVMVRTANPMHRLNRL